MLKSHAPFTSAHFITATLISVCAIVRNSRQTRLWNLSVCSNAPVLITHLNILMLELVCLHCLQSLYTLGLEHVLKLIFYWNNGALRTFLMLLTSGLSKRSQVVRVQHMMMFSLADESIWLLCTSSLCEPHLACKIKKIKKSVLHEVTLAFSSPSLVCLLFSKLNLGLSIEWYRMHSQVLERWSPAGGSGDCQVQLRSTDTVWLLLQQQPVSQSASQSERPWGLNNKKHSTGSYPGH